MGEDRCLGSQAVSLSALGWLALAEGDLAGARDLLGESLAIYSTGLARNVAVFLIASTADLPAPGRPEIPFRLLGAARALAERFGAPVAVSLEARLKHQLKKTEQMLSEPAAARAWTEGQSMSLEEAIALAREILG